MLCLLGPLTPPIDLVNDSGDVNPDRLISCSKHIPVPPVPCPYLNPKAQARRLHQAPVDNTLPETADVSNQEHLSDRYTGPPSDAYRRTIDVPVHAKRNVNL